MVERNRASDVYGTVVVRESSQTTTRAIIVSLGKGLWQGRCKRESSLLSYLPRHDLNRFDLLADPACPVPQNGLESVSKEDVSEHHIITRVDKAVGTPSE